MSRIIHLINPLWDLNGGSEWRTLALYDQLKAHCRLTLWSEAEPDPRIPAAYPIRRIDPAAGDFPRGGTIILIGAYFRIGPWLDQIRPDRLILIYNTAERSHLDCTLPRLIPLAPEGVEIVYASEKLRRATGLPGCVQASLIDLERFVPASRRAKAVFTVGRLSRPHHTKHHWRDPALYWRLAWRGCRIRIMGPDPGWTDRVLDHPGITLIEAGSMPAEEFLQSLDCFLYRTSPRWVEPSGRVVVEAMACGLPVVCHRSGGYSEYIEHGEDGFLFDSQFEALRLVMKLARDEGLRRSIGKAARRKAESLFSEEERSRIVQFYLA